MHVLLCSFSMSFSQKVYSNGGEESQDCMMSSCRRIETKPPISLSGTPYACHANSYNQRHSLVELIVANYPVWLGDRHRQDHHQWLGPLCLAQQ